MKELTDMGFDRAQSELALRASFYHVERAAEYLITVNGSSIERRHASVQFFPRVTSLLWAKDLPRVKEADQLKHQLAQKVRVVADDPSEVNKALSDSTASSNALFVVVFVLVDDLSELSNNPQFQALRHLIQQNPEQLQTLMQTLQATQPELFQVGETHVDNAVHCSALLDASS